jgi:hypothetical protein
MVNTSSKAFLYYSLQYYYNLKLKNEFLSGKSRVINSRLNSNEVEKESSSSRQTCCRWLSTRKKIQVIDLFVMLHIFLLLIAFTKKIIFISRQETFS